VKRTLLLWLACCLSAPAQARQVTATVYHPAFHGGVTYCGQTYQHWGISAAHPWLPCGTKLRLSHRGRSLVVPVTDRCDCSSVDLSADRLGVPLDGTATIQLH
jgi:rare lipoprotein A